MARPGRVGRGRLRFGMAGHGMVLVRRDEPGLGVAGFGMANFGPAWQG